VIGTASRIWRLCWKAKPCCRVRSGFKVRYVLAAESPQRRGMDYLTEDPDFHRTEH
jgi:hypothetical protein